MSIFDKIFGDYSAREVKRIQPTLQKVLSYEEEYKKLSDEEAERYWTIQKNAYIMQGEYVTAEQWQFDTFSFRSGVILKEAIEDLAKLRKYDESFITITEYADNTVRGTDRTKHWRIGGA